MKNKKKLFGKTMGLIAALVLCFGMTVLAAPSVTGDTELTVQKDKIVSASYKITNDDSIESVKLTLSCLLYTSIRLMQLQSWERNMETSSLLYIRNCGV